MAIYINGGRQHDRHNFEKQSMNFRKINSNTRYLFHRLISIFYSDVSHIEVFQINHWIRVHVLSSTGIFSNFIHLQKWMLSQSHVAEAKVFKHTSMNSSSEVGFVGFFLFWIQVLDVAIMETLAIYTQQIHHEGTTAPLSSHGPHLIPADM